MKTIATILTGAAALCGLATSAGAVSFTTSGAMAGGIAVDPGFGSQTLIYDFNALTPAAGALTGDFGIVAAPGTPSVNAAPSGTPAGTNFLTVPLVSIPGSATLSLGGAYSDVSFYWGSIDTAGHNTLSVLGAGGSVIATITGDQAATPTATGDQSGVGTNRRIFLTADSGEVITGFTFAANQFAFETDTFAGTAVPEPSTWGLMILGFGLVGAGARRRRRLASLA